MSKLKLSPNLFLEVAELERFRQFLEDDGWKRFCKYLIKSPGIVQNTGNTLLKVSGNATNNTVTVNAGLAFDSNLDAIVLSEDTTISVPYSTTKQWIVISRAVTNYEDGTVSVSSQGALTGSNTEFLSVLRGQPNFPTKVKLNSTKNTSEYEVVEVNSNTEAVLSGDFVAESGLKYEVIGTFTPGFQPTDDDRLIYEYDSCEIEVISSDDTPTLDEGQFLLASIEYTSLINMAVIDERSNYMFNSTARSSSEDLSSNPLVSLFKTTLNDKILDIQFEWGYKVNMMEFLTTSTDNIFHVITGTSIFTGTDDISNDFFNGWIILNRKNMASVRINDTIGNYLYLEEYNPDLITNVNDDFIIIPDFSQIEVEIAVSGTNYDTDDYKYHFLFNIDNRDGRVSLPLQYGDSKLTLKYRMLNSSESTIFQNFAVASFTNSDGEPEVLGDSSFEVNVDEPEVTTRNYS